LQQLDPDRGRRCDSGRDEGGQARGDEREQQGEQHGVEHRAEQVADQPGYEQFRGDAEHDRERDGQQQRPPPGSVVRPACP
jgi:hypothetical protein